MSGDSRPLVADFHQSGGSGPSGLVIGSWSFFKYFLA